MCLLRFPCAKLQKRIKKYELRNNIFFLFAHIIYNVSISGSSIKTLTQKESPETKFEAF